ncbi:MAG: TonB-dependent siderophore receptor, partial [Sphingobium sp.]
MQFVRNSIWLAREGDSIDAWGNDIRGKEAGCDFRRVTGGIPFGNDGCDHAGPGAGGRNARIRYPAQPLQDAIVLFNRQSGIQITADGGVTAGRTSTAVKGNQTPSQALSILLSGTGLTWRWLDSRSVALERAPQAADGAVQLGPVRVEGAAGSGAGGVGSGWSRDPGATEGTGSYTTRALTIGKSPQSLREIPQSVSVVTRQRIEDQNLTTLDEAMAQTTGIIVSNAGGSTANVGLSSRGFTISSIQRDGVPTQNSVSQPDLAIYDRVEVLRGAAGLFTGAGLPGGTINLVRKRALNSTQFQGTAIAGTWSNFRAEADATGPLTASGAVRGRIVGVYQNRDYFFDAKRTDRGLIYGRLEFDLSPDTVLSLGGIYEHRETPYTNGLPFATTGANLHLPRSVSLAAYWSTWTFKKPEFFAELEHQFGPDWSLRVSATRSNENSIYKTASAFGAVNPVTLQGSMISSTTYENRRIHQDGIDIVLNGKFDLFGREQEIVVGANYASRVQKSRMATLPYSYQVDPFNFDPASIVEPIWPAWTSGSSTDVEQLGGHAVLRLNPFDHLKIAIGARLSGYSLKGRNLLTNIVTQDYKRNNEITPYAGIVYDLNDRLSVYASYADIFQVQNNFTFEGEMLTPIVGTNYEAGIKGEFADGALNASVAVFRIDQSNRAQLDPDHPTPCAGSPNGTCYIAEGKVRSEGIEFEITGKILPNLDIVSGYTFNKTKYLRDRTAGGVPSANEGQTFSSQTPKHLFRLW